MYKQFTHYTPLTLHTLYTHCPRTPPHLTHTVCTSPHLTLLTAMFTLFVCVTQDGWVDVTMELNECGYSILGALYLVSFVTLGAFVFSNLVVAVVVTNLVSP